MAYLTLTQFRARTLMKPADVDGLEAKRSGYIELHLEETSAYLDSRLRKRYAAPFVGPVPVAVLRWLRQIVTLQALLGWGFDPESKQDAIIQAEHDLAIAEVKEAADSKEGLFDLPLRQDTTDTGVVYGGPLAYSEASPYTWVDKQREAIACEQ